MKKRRWAHAPWRVAARVFASSPSTAPKINVAGAPFREVRNLPMSFDGSRLPIGLATSSALSSLVGHCF